MPSASSVSSTRRRIASRREPEVLEHEREVALHVVDDELRLGVLGDEARRRRRARAGDASVVDRPNTTTSPREPPAARVRNEPVRAAQQRALARARRADDEEQLARLDLEVGTGERGVPARRDTRSDTFADGDRAHDVTPRASERPARAAEQRERGHDVQRGPAQRRRVPERGCCRRRSSRPRDPTGASEHGADHQPVGSRHAARPVPRRASRPDDASITAPASPMAPPSPSTAASVRRSPIERDERAAEREQRRDARTNRRRGRVARRRYARSRARPSTRTG